MIVKLTKIQAGPLAVMLGGVHALVGLAVGAAVTLGALASSEEREGLWALGPWAMLLLPLVNAFLGAAAGLVLAGFYNLNVKWFGGIQVEFDQQDQVVSLKQIEA